VGRLTFSRIKEIDELGRPSRTEGSTAATFRRIVATADRDHTGTYFTIVDFESFDSAMENSGRPETSEFAAKMAELCDGPVISTIWMSCGRTPETARATASRLEQTA
jgi:hypothetical protein